MKMSIQIQIRLYLGMSRFVIEKGSDVVTLARETSSMERDSFEGRDYGGCRCRNISFVLEIVLYGWPSPFTFARWRGWSHNPGVSMVTMC
jgi:hypothetical protein